MTGEEITGQRVRDLRKKARLNQKQLGDLAGVGRSTVISIEKNDPSVQPYNRQQVWDALRAEAERLGVGDSPAVQPPSTLQPLEPDWYEMAAELEDMTTEQRARVLRRYVTMAVFGARGPNREKG